MRSQSTDSHPLHQRNYGAFLWAEWGAVMAKLCQNERFLNGRSNGSGRKICETPSFPRHADKSGS